MTVFKPFGHSLSGPIARPFWISVCAPAFFSVHKLFKWFREHLADYGSTAFALHHSSILHPIKSMAWTKKKKTEEEEKKPTVLAIKCNWIWFVRGFPKEVNKLCKVNECAPVLSCVCPVWRFFPFFFSFNFLYQTHRVKVSPKVVKKN